MCLSRFGLVLFYFVMYLVPSFSQAYSFDCRRATTRIDRVICAVPELSRLDEDMASQYRDAIRVSKNAELQRKRHMAWLKSRVSCSDSRCLVEMYRARISELEAVNSSSGSNDSLAGVWVQVYPCVKNCADSFRDQFELRIQQTGIRVCGQHLSTAQMGNRVDEIEGSGFSILGKVGGEGAEVYYSSSWGGKGRASMRIVDNILVWTVLSHEGESWMPQQGWLIRKAASAGLTECPVETAQH